ncbi:MAG: hypothetical protein HS116_10125 [Planctomycetes bacterium]|nr:hypothetical protein [Planctomycetota bacterium]
MAMQEAAAGGAGSDALKVFTPDRLHPAQRAIHAHPARIRVAACGRRFGKTTLGLVEAVQTASKTPNALVWWVSAAKEQAKRHAWKLKRELDCAHEKNGKHRSDRIEFRNGSVLEFLSALSGDRLRGEGLDFLVIDEAADVPEEVWTSVLRPALVDRRGRALILGTPRGRGNWLHRLYLQGQDPALERELRAFRFPTLQNPKIKAEELESTRTIMTALEFKQEFEAEFVDGTGKVFGDVRALATCEKRAVGREHARYFTGIDLARSGDYTVLASLRAPDPDVASVLPPAARMEGYHRMRGLPWDEQLRAIKDHLRRFPGPCVVDATGLGDPVAEQIRAFHPDTEAYHFSSVRKQNLVRGLLLGFDLKRLYLLPEETLLNELESFEAEEPSNWSRGRAPKYGAPAGQHDDTVIALGLAWWGLCQREGMPGIDEAGLQAAGRMFRFGFFAR